MSAKKITRGVLLYAIPLGLFLSLLFTKCYGPEIDTLREDLDGVKSDFDQLKAFVESKTFVTSVSPLADDGTGNSGFTISFDDGTTYPIRNGVKGAPGKTWKINDVDSLWMYSDDGGNNWDYFYTDPNNPTTSRIKAIPKDGKQGVSAPAPKISQQGFWILTHWDDTLGAFVSDTTKTAAALNPYLKVDIDSVYIDLFMPKIDSINYVPPRILFDSLRLPLYREPLLIYFKGFGHLQAVTKDVKMITVDPTFDLWRVNPSLAWKGAPYKPDTLLLTRPGQFRFDSLVVVFTTNKPISLTASELVLKDSKFNEFNLFDIGQPQNVEGLMTKVNFAGDTLIYYAFMKLKTTINLTDWTLWAPTVPTATQKVGKSIYYSLILNDAVKSVATYPVQVNSPAMLDDAVILYDTEPVSSPLMEVLPATSPRMFILDYSINDTIQAIWGNDVRDVEIVDITTGTPDPINAGIINVIANGTQFEHKVATTPPVATDVIFNLMIRKLLMNGALDSIYINVQAQYP